MAIDLSKCLPSASIGFGISGGIEIKASLCEFSIKLPSISFPFGLSLPAIPFPPPFPFPKFALSLSCDPKNPIDISAGLEWGGGRLGCFEETKVE